LDLEFVISGHETSFSEHYITFNGSLSKVEEELAYSHFEESYI
jgi:hypothetical protein